jgi:O-antigen ligase
MDDLLMTLFEIGLFFIFLIVNLQLFNTLQFEKLFKKRVQPRQMQLMYFFIVIIFTYLLTRSIMHIIELSVSLTQ